MCCCYWCVGGSGERGWNKEWVSCPWNRCITVAGHMVSIYASNRRCQSIGQRSANLYCSLTVFCFEMVELFFLILLPCFRLNIWLKLIYWTFGNKRRLLLLDSQLWSCVHTSMDQSRVWCTVGLHGQDLFCHIPRVLNWTGTLGIGGPGLCQYHSCGQTRALPLGNAVATRDVLGLQQCLGWMLRVKWHRHERQGFPAEHCIVTGWSL